MLNVAQIRNVLIDEIGIQGPTGVTLPQLWSIALVHPAISAKKELTLEYVKQLVWEALLSYEELSFFTRVFKHGCREYVCESQDPIQDIKHKYQIINLDVIKDLYVATKKYEVIIVADQRIIRKVIGICDVETSRWNMSEIMYKVLLRIARTRTDGAIQSEIADEFQVQQHNFFYIIKQLEIRNLIVRKAIAAPNNKSNNKFVRTNILHLKKYAPQVNMGPQQMFKMVSEGKTKKDAVSSQLYSVYDDSQWFRKLCEQFGKTGENVLLEHDLKLNLGLRSIEGHRIWRRIRKKGETKGLIRVFIGNTNGKAMQCVKLLKNWSSDLEDTHSDTKINADEKPPHSFICEVSQERQVIDYICSCGRIGATSLQISSSMGLSKRYLSRKMLEIIKRYNITQVTDNISKVILNRYVASEELLDSYRQEQENQQEWIQLANKAKNAGIVKIQNLEQEQQVMEEVSDVTDQENGMQETPDVGLGRSGGRLESLQAIDGASDNQQQENTKEVSLFDCFVHEEIEELLPVVLKEGVAQGDEDMIYQGQKYTQTTCWRMRMIATLLQHRDFILRAEIKGIVVALENMQGLQRVPPDTKTVVRFVELLCVNGRARLETIRVDRKWFKYRNFALLFLVAPNVVVDKEFEDKVKDYYSRYSTALRLRCTPSNAVIEAQQQGKLQIEDLPKILPLQSQTSIDRNQQYQGSVQGGYLHHRSVYPEGKTPSQILAQNGFLKSKCVRVRLLHYFICKLVGLGGFSQPTLRKFAASQGCTGLPLLKTAEIQKSKQNVEVVGNVRFKFVGERLDHSEDTEMEEMETSQIENEMHEQSDAIIDNTRQNQKGALNQHGQADKMEDRRQNEQSRLIVSPRDIWDNMTISMFFQIIGNAKEYCDLQSLSKGIQYLGDYSVEEQQELLDGNTVMRFGRYLDVLVRLQLVSPVYKELVGKADQEGSGDFPTHYVVSKTAWMEIPEDEEEAAAAENSEQEEVSTEDNQVLARRRVDFDIQSQLDDYWLQLEQLFTTQQQQKTSCFPVTVVPEFLNENGWSSNSLMTMSQFLNLKNTLEQNKANIDFYLCRKIASELNVDYSEVLKNAQRVRAKYRMECIMQGLEVPKPLSLERGEKIKEMKERRKKQQKEERNSRKKSVRERKIKKLEKQRKRKQVEEIEEQTGKKKKKKRGLKEKLQHGDYVSLDFGMKPTIEKHTLLRAFQKRSKQRRHSVDDTIFDFEEFQGDEKSQARLSISDTDKDSDTDMEGRPKKRRRGFVPYKLWWQDWHDRQLMIAYYRFRVELGPCLQAPWKIMTGLPHYSTACMRRYQRLRLYPPPRQTILKLDAYAALVYSMRHPDDQSAKQWLQSKQISGIEDVDPELAQQVTLLSPRVTAFQQDLQHQNSQQQDDQNDFKDEELSPPEATPDPEENHNGLDLGVDLGIEVGVGVGVDFNSPEIKPEQDETVLVPDQKKYQVDQNKRKIYVDEEGQNKRQKLDPSEIQTKKGKQFRNSVDQKSHQNKQDLNSNNISSLDCKSFIQNLDDKTKVNPEKEKFKSVNQILPENFASFQQLQSNFATSTIQSHIDFFVAKNEQEEKLLLLMHTTLDTLVQNLPHRSISTDQIIHQQQKNLNQNSNQSSHDLLVNNVRYRYFSLQPELLLNNSIRRRVDSLRARPRIRKFFPDVWVSNAMNLICSLLYSAEKTGNVAQNASFVLTTRFYEDQIKKALTNLKRIGIIEQSLRKKGFQLSKQFYEQLEHNVLSKEVLNQNKKQQQKVRQIFCQQDEASKTRGKKRNFTSNQQQTNIQEKSEVKIIPGYQLLQNQNCFSGDFWENSEPKNIMNVDEDFVYSGNFMIYLIYQLGRKLISLNIQIQLEEVVDFEDLSVLNDLDRLDDTKIQVQILQHHKDQFCMDNNNKQKTKTQQKLISPKKGRKNQQTINENIQKRLFQPYQLVFNEQIRQNAYQQCAAEIESRNSGFEVSNQIFSKMGKFLNSTCEVGATFLDIEQFFQQEQNLELGKLDVQEILQIMLKFGVIRKVPGYYDWIYFLGQHSQEFVLSPKLLTVQKFGTTGKFDIKKKNNDDDGYNNGAKKSKKKIARIKQQEESGEEKNKEEEEDNLKNNKCQIVDQRESEFLQISEDDQRNCSLDVDLVQKIKNAERCLKSNLQKSPKAEKPQKSAKRRSKRTQDQKKMQEQQQQQQEQEISLEQFGDAEEKYIRPWLSPEGDFSEAIFSGLNKRIFDVVYMRPGICLEEIGDRIQVICRHDLQQLVQNLVTAQILEERIVQENVLDFCPSIFSNLQDVYKETKYYYCKKVDVLFDHLNLMEV